MKQNQKYFFLGKYPLVSICLIFMFAISCSKEKNDIETAPDIALNKSSLILEKGQTERLIASFTPSDTPNKGHIWESSDARIATVDETGIVSAVGIGESVITVTALAGKKMAKCQVKVTDKIIHVTSISLSETEANMIIGEKIQLDAIVLPNNATDKTIIWNSSDNKVASVNEQGLVTAIAEGENSITATTNDGEKVASCKIKVRGKGVEISKPKISDITSISASVTGTFKAFGINVQESGICYSISQSPTIDDKKIVLSGNEIAYTLTELETAQTYYVRIYVIVEGKVHYGEEGAFSTTGLIETHFQPTDIYVDKVSLVSPGISGAKSINVCYGKFPNPKITDNIATATTGSDGKLHLNLIGLEKGTNYYIRVYYRNGSNIKYYDDEVSVQTIGKDFQIEGKMNKYEEYDYYDPAGYKHTRYRAFFNYTYNIKPTGTYIVETRYSSTIAKTTDYSESIFIKNGTGNFNLKQELGVWSYEGASTYIDFLSEDTLIFTNIENNLRYHWVIPQKCYVRNY